MLQVLEDRSKPSYQNKEDRFPASHHTKSETVILVEQPWSRVHPIQPFRTDCRELVGRVSNVEDRHKHTPTIGRRILFTTRAVILTVPTYKEDDYSIVRYSYEVAACKDPFRCKLVPESPRYRGIHRPESEKDTSSP